MGHQLVCEFVGKGEGRSGEREGEWREEGNLRGGEGEGRERERGKGGGSAILR